MKNHHKVYTGPTVASNFDRVLANDYGSGIDAIVYVGTENVYIHPSVSRLEIDLGGSLPWVYVRDAE